MVTGSAVLVVALPAHLPHRQTFFASLLPPTTFSQVPAGM
jgi:hypothetical protein